MPNPHVEINSKAPAIAAVDAFIEAPVETVWAILSDFEKWPAWNKSVSKIQVNGPVKPGTTFVWVGGGSKIVSRVEDVDPPRRIAWSGRMFGIRAVHVWELEGDGGGTRVHTEESFAGLVARLFRGFARKALAKALDQGLSALKAEAETRAGRP